MKYEMNIMTRPGHLSPHPLHPFFIPGLCKKVYITEPFSSSSSSLSLSLPPPRSYLVCVISIDVYL